MKKIIDNYILKFKKETIIKSILYFLTFLGFFYYLDIYFIKCKETSFYSVLRYENFENLCLIMSISIFTFFLVFFHETSIEKDYDKAIIESTSSKKDKIVKFIISELLVGLFSYISLIVFSLIIKIIHYLIMKNQFIFLDLYILKTYALTLLSLVVSVLLSLIFKYIIYEKKDDEHNNYSLIVYFSIGGIIAYMLSEKSKVFIFIFLLIVLLLVSYVSYVITDYIIKIRMTKIKSIIHKNLISRKLINRYTFYIIIITFMVFGFMSDVNQYRVDTKYFNYDYIIETENLEKTVIALSQTKDYTYLEIKDEKIGYIKNNSIDFIYTNINDISLYYNFTIVEKMSYIPENSLVLPYKYKTILSLNVGDTVSIMIDNNITELMIYEYIDSCCEYYGFINQSNSTLNEKILLKTYNNEIDNLKIEDEIIKKENIYNLKFYDFCKTKLFTSLIIVLILSSMMTITILKERLIYLNEKDLFIKKLRSLNVRIIKIQGFISQVNYFSFVITYLFLYIVIYFIINKYKVAISSLNLELFTNFNFVIYFIYEIDIFIFFNIIILITNIIINQRLELNYER